MEFFAISDLHVEGPDDPLYHSLLRLLRNRAQPGDTVVLAGDIFDLFVGNKSLFVNRYAVFFEALREASLRGVSLHYIEGNHDFLIRRAFRNIPGLVVHAEKVVVQKGSRRFYVAHGDLVDQSDLGYRVLRHFFRSPLMKAIVTLVPGAWLDWFGQRSSLASRARNQAMWSGDRVVSIERREELRRKYRSFAAERLAEGHDYVVLGHCHDLDEMGFVIGGRMGKYMNIGYPRAHGSFLSWTDQDAQPDLQREPLP